METKDNNVIRFLEAEKELKNTCTEFDDAIVKLAQRFEKFCSRDKLNIEDIKAYEDQVMETYKGMGTDLKAIVSCYAKIGMLVSKYIVNNPIASVSCDDDRKIFRKNCIMSLDEISTSKHTEPKTSETTDKKDFSKTMENYMYFMVNNKPYRKVRICNAPFGRASLRNSSFEEHYGGMIWVPVDNMKLKYCLLMPLKDVPCYASQDFLMVLDVNKDDIIEVM